jgi:hypothetical protein
VSDREFREHLIQASRVVSTWPAWKQKLLEQSSKPTVDVPRNPVDNQKVVEEAFKLPKSEN